MADVFISYAREDQQFVRRLQDALEEHNRETWIDWKDIPLTAKWKQEVFSAIEQADSFAAVISPDFIVSKSESIPSRRAAYRSSRHSFGAGAVGPRECFWTTRGRGGSRSTRGRSSTPRASSWWIPGKRPGRPNPATSRGGTPSTAPRRASTWHPSRRSAPSCGRSVSSQRRFARSC